MGKAETWSMATVKEGKRGKKVATFCCHRFNKKKLPGKGDKGSKEKIEDKE